MQIKQDLNAESIYIHIPFCIRKCNYCSFISFTNITKYEDAYIDALIKDIKSVNNLQGAKTIYFGGGTPNLLSLKSLEKIFNALHDTFKIESFAEITMEFNPKISDLSYINEVKSMGINRISLGAQSFNNNILRTLNRIHTAEDTFKTIEHIKSANINNFSLDLIYGIFGQNLEDIKKDLSVIKSINPKHVSTYGLKIEDNTPFAKFDKSNLPDEDLCADMYMLICEELNNSNYIHYEISNFAQKNFEAKHNLTYWENKNYLAFGVAAHGYINNLRYKNTNNLEDYIVNPLEKEIINNNTISDIIEEKIFLGLRLKKGINLSEIKKAYGIDLIKIKSDFINQLIENDYANFINNNLALSEKGFLISNYILAELCNDLNKYSLQ